MPLSTKYHTRNKLVRENNILDEDSNKLLTTENKIKEPLFNDISKEGKTLLSYINKFK